MVKQADAKHAMTWWENDAKYKARGRAMTIKYNNACDDELKVMSKGKVGRPFSYSNTMMDFTAIHKALLGKSFRVFAGFMDGSLDKFPTTIHFGRGLPRPYPHLQLTLVVCGKLVDSAQPDTKV